ncbi:MAG: asparagine synthase (glutamine-hydrolyzing) [Bacteroidia bacterium]
MCGIAGAISFTEKGKSVLNKIDAATACLAKRGPDAEGFFREDWIAFGHRRLSIIDTSAAGGQPMTDASGRYIIIFNGEFFNYKQHRKDLLRKGIQLNNESDTEVLLNLYILEGEKCLDKVNGFFALAIYDKQEQTVFIARDRMGVKPLLIFEDDDQLLFASEMKSLLAFGIPKELDEVSLFTYLQLNYIPAPHSIFKNVRKMQAGSFIKIDLKRQQQIRHHTAALEKKFYEIPFKEKLAAVDYEQSKKKLYELMDASVERRLVADVPLGAFLSGGIDSSVITGIAAQKTKNLNTFSIGFKDEPMFDETNFAQMVAKKHNTNHTVFSLTNNDLFEVLHDALDYIDEPFADSSALNVFILSRHTRKHVTVALSGDGADELFGGYNKHRAEWMMRNNPSFVQSAKLFSSLLKPISGSRNSKIGNKIRQVHRFAKGAQLTAQQRYWRWCAFIDHQDAEKLLQLKSTQFLEYQNRKNEIIKNINGSSDMNDVFDADMHLVLQNDMLTKVDLMSMANSLEVRTPFLDYELVDFAFTLPSEFKIDKTVQKKIVKDTFRNLLPEEIFNRGKQGFEVPLLKWFRTELKSMITDDLLSDAFIKEQNIFNLSEIQKLKTQLFSNNPGEIHARIWGLIVFQYWWRKTIDV